MSASLTPEPDLERWGRVEAVLDALLDAERSHRPALLDRLCEGDADLHGEVEDLLGREESSRSLLRAPGPSLARDLLEGSHDEGAADGVEGRRIGPYRVLREIGRGGMGRVYLAERADGEFEQLIALKLLRPGLDEPEAERRFRSERHILASLEHPNIARLIDGGVTGEAVPWLAMEYVEGSPIDEYSETRDLTVRQRLELFLVLLSAVQYAHRNLVVHRDLKPSNIQIGPDGRLKLLDFGIAKLLSEAEGEGTPLTRPGQRFLTPEYSAPEQLRGEPVTTATDVYQLGVVLYELLAGRRPFERRGNSLGELQEAILGRDPERPSTAVSGTGRGGDDARPTRGAGGRGMAPDRLRRALAGDLDAIVLMALRKEAAQRYASAGEMGEDLRRYLAGLPVLAREPGRVYRFRKFVRRHRWGVAVAAGFVLIATGFGTIHTVRVTQERNQVRLEAAKSAQVTAFLLGLFEANDPRVSGGDSITARELLARGSEQVETLGEQPEVQAEMLGVLGNVYASLGRYDEARPLLERAVATRRVLSGGGDADLAQSLHDLASVRTDLGDYAAAEPLFREALARRRESLGDEHSDVASTLDGLGGLLHAMGEHEAAESLLLEALAMQRRLRGERHPDVARTLSKLGVLLMDIGEFDRSEAAHREALAMRRELLGEEHLDVTYSLNNLALVLHRVGDYQAAEALYRQVLALDRKLLGEQHPDYALDLNNLGGLLASRGDRDGADSLHREALAIYRQALGPAHPRIAQSLNNLAGVRYREGDYEAAEQLFREALGMRRTLLGGAHPATATTMSNLAATLLQAGDLREAEAIYREVLALRRDRLGPDHPDVANSLNGLARVLVVNGRPAEAEPYFRESVRIAGASFGEESWVTANYSSGLGACLTALGRYAEAEPALVTAHAVLAAERGSEHQDTITVLERLVALYEAWGKPDDAARYRAASGD